MLESSPSRRDLAYEHIKNAIVNGRLKPGDVVSEKFFIDELGVSRTPVREAINSLAQEELVTVIPRQGTVVSPISVADVMAQYETRLLIEPYMIKKAMPAIDKKELEQMKALFRQPQTPDSLKLTPDIDSQFHLYIAKCANNSFLYRLESTLMLNSYRARVLSNRLSQNRFKAARDEHLEIIDAILADDADTAMSKMTDHLEKSYEGYLQIYQNTGFITL